MTKDYLLQLSLIQLKNCKSSFGKNLTRIYPHRDTIIRIYKNLCSKYTVKDFETRFIGVGDSVQWLARAPDLSAADFSCMNI